MQLRLFSTIARLIAALLLCQPTSLLAEPAQTDCPFLPDSISQSFSSSSQIVNTDFIPMGDINGDGHADAVTPLSAGGLSVLFLDAGRNIVSRVDHPSSVYIFQAKPYQDVNNDGIKELIVALPLSGSGSVGMYSFDSAGQITSFNVIARSQITSLTFWLLGIGTAHPGASSARIDTFGVSIAIVGDVDGNGADDIAIGALNARPYHGYRNYEAAGGVVLMLMGTDGLPIGGRVLSTGRDQLEGLGFRVAAVGDLDEDGVPDLVVSTTRKQLLRFFFLNSDGSVKNEKTVTLPEIYSDDRDGRPITISPLGDIDNDGDQDLGMQLSFSGAQREFLALKLDHSSDNLVSDFRVCLLPTEGIQDAILGEDLNDDGLNDLFMPRLDSSSPSGPEWTLSALSPADLFSSLDECPLDATRSTAGFCGCDTDTVDTDGDSVPDCVDSCAGGDDNTDSDADGTPDACDLCPSDPLKVSEGNCGCGQPETALCDQFHCPILSNSIESSEVSPFATLEQYHFATTIKYVDDLDGDGFDDLIAGTAHPNYLVVTLLNQDQSVKSVAAYSAADVTGTPNSTVPIAQHIEVFQDTNDDGRDELLVGGGGQIYMVSLDANGLLSSSTIIDQQTHFQSGMEVAFNHDRTSGPILNVGDIDGNGADDLVLSYTAYTGLTGAIRAPLLLKYMNPDGTIMDSDSVPLTNHFQQGWSTTLVGDLNDDGVPEIAVSAPDAATSAVPAGLVSIVSVTDSANLISKIYNYNSLLPRRNYDDAYFGVGLQAIDDLDGDGHKELAVRSILRNDASTESPGHEYLHEVAILYLDNSVSDPVKDTEYCELHQLRNRAVDFTPLTLGSDVDGDGTRDLLLGEDFFDSPLEGRVRTFSTGQLGQEPDACPNDDNKTAPGLCGCGVSDTADSDADSVPDCIDACQGFNDADDADSDGTPDGCDDCPNDPEKVDQGVCACGVNDDADEDMDTAPDCLDLCPGFDDRDDADFDGTPDGCDACPQDDTKTVVGACGCGTADIDTDTDGVPDCNDICAAGDDTVDTDNDGLPNACDLCPDNPALGATPTATCEGDGTTTPPDGGGQPGENPGTPGDGGSGDGENGDSGNEMAPDSDGDGIPDSNDQCAAGDDNADRDNDGTPDACDECPDLTSSQSAGLCGCGIAEEDLNNDGVIDCTVANEIEDIASNINDSTEVTKKTVASSIGSVIKVLKKRGENLSSIKSKAAAKKQIKRLKKLRKQARKAKGKKIGRIAKKLSKLLDKLTQ